jgi:hypothetical protein
MPRAEPARRARRLVRWYPKEWRARYGEEFTQLLADDISERPRSWHRTLDVARSGLAAQMAQRQLTGLRLAAAALTFGAGLAGAAFLHAVVDPNRQINCPRGRNPQAECLIVPGHGWVNPTAIAIASLGIAAAVGFLFTAFLRLLQRGRAATAVTIGGAIAAALWITTYGRAVPGYGPTAYPGASISPSPAWAVIEAVLVGIAVVAVAFAVIRDRQALNKLTLATAVLVLGTALTGALFPHVVAGPGGRLGCDPHGLQVRLCGLVADNRWVEPTALALCVLAVTGAVGLLLSVRRARS